MRFALAHKTTTYLMLAFAFVAMLTGGGVPPLIVLLGAVGLVVSWWWEAPRVRVERWALAWTIGSVVMLAWSVVTAVGTGDWFGAAGGFLVWLVVAKAFQRRASKDWQQLQLLSFLMLVAGAVLNPGLSFGLAFLGFVVAATWAMILSHLRREMEDNFLLRHDGGGSERVEVRRILESRRIVDRRFFAGTGAVSIGVFLASAVLFLSIPRVGAGFFMRPQQGLSFVGFHDGVKLGAHGTIKNDPTIVMRVTVPPEYQGRDAPALHWRGVAFDQYDRGEWKRSPMAPQTVEFPEDDGPRVRRHVYTLDRNRAPMVEQTVYLDPIDTDVLFGASMPIDFETDKRPTQGDLREEHLDDVRLAHEDKIRYSVWSRIEAPPADELRGEGKTLPPGYDVFLAYPKDQISADTVALAHRLTDGLDNDYDKATAIADYLRATYPYSLDLPDPGDDDPIDYFLFHGKRGHCEYFASSFAILARVAGVPTRVVNGFYGGEWNEFDDYIAVRAGDAHSWDEVWLGQAGWVTFDATPAGQDQLGRGGDGIGDRLSRWLDSLRFQWSKWVIEYDLGRQTGLFRDLGNALRDAGKWVERTAKAGKAVLIALGIAIVAVVMFFYARGRRRRPGAPVRARGKPKKTPIAALYARVLGRLEKLGVARGASTTPRELAREVHARGLPFAAALAELTELYYAATWGGDEPPDLLERAQVLAAKIQLPR